MLAEESCLVVADRFLVTEVGIALGLEVDTEETVGLAASGDGGVEDSASNGEGFALELELHALWFGGGSDGKAREQAKMARGVSSAGVVRVGKIEALGFEHFLDFCKVGSGANFAESDNVWSVARENFDDSLFFRIGLWRAFERLSVDIAVHREPVLDVVAASDCFDRAGGACVVEVAIDHDACFGV